MPIALAFFGLVDPRRRTVGAAKQAEKGLASWCELDSLSVSESGTVVLACCPAVCFVPRRWCLTGPPQYAAWLLAAPECSLSQLTAFASYSRVTKEKLGGGLMFFREGILKGDRWAMKSALDHLLLNAGSSIFHNVQSMK